MSRSAWFSHVRLWICLALLLATNLANVIDGFPLADVAKCVCEEAEDANGITFLLQGERIGSVRLIEDDFVAIDVRQADFPPESVNWEVESFIQAESVNLQPRTGESTLLEIEMPFERLPSEQRQIQVSFTENGDPPQRYEANLRVDLRAYKVVRVGYDTDYLGFSNPLLLDSSPGSPVQMGQFVFEVRNSSPERDWQLLRVYPSGTLALQRGLEVSGRKIGANRFEVDFEFDPENFGEGLADNSSPVIRVCGRLNLILGGPDAGNQAIGGIPIAVAHQFDPASPLCF